MFHRLKLRPYEEELIQLRRYFHKFPELSGEEVKTSQFIGDYLKCLGLEVHRGLAQTGVIALLQGHQGGKTIGFRADMDALPIEEKNKVSYRSSHRKKMHACGHDGHMAVTLITAKILSTMKDSLKGTIYFIFQPAEEDLTDGGAKILYQEGQRFFDKMDAIFGFHFWPLLESGTVALSPDPMMVAGDIFEVSFKGQGAHGANPHQSSDVLLMASSAVMALTTIISRRIEPGLLSTFSVGVMEAGKSPNVLPDSACIKGTTRYIDPAMGEFFPAKIHQVLKGITDSYNGTYKLQYTYGYPVLQNDREMVELVRECAVSLLGAWEKMQF